MSDFGDHFAPTSRIHLRPGIELLLRSPGSLAEREAKTRKTFCARRPQSWPSTPIFTLQMSDFRDNFSAHAFPPTPTLYLRALTSRSKLPKRLAHRNNGTGDTDEQSRLGEGRARHSSAPAGLMMATCKNDLELE